MQHPTGYIIHDLPWGNRRERFRVFDHQGHFLSQHADFLKACSALFDAGYLKAALVEAGVLREFTVPVHLLHEAGC